MSLGFRTAHAVPNCSEYNHNVANNRFRLESNVPKTAVARDSLLVAFFETHLICYLR